MSASATYLSFPPGHGANSTSIEVNAPACRANLDADERMYREVSSGSQGTSWRLYVNPPCVVIGRHQREEEEADLSTCAGAGIPVLRRFTGGGAVYHDAGNLNFAVCEPARRGVARAPLLYEKYAEWIPGLLGEMGISARIDGAKVLASDLKISGLAARVGVRAVFVHGTLLVSTDLQALRRFLRARSCVRAYSAKVAGPRAASLPWPETTVSAECGREVSVDWMESRARELLRGRFGPGEFSSNLFSPAQPPEAEDRR